MKSKEVNKSEKSINKKGVKQSTKSRKAAFPLLTLLLLVFLLQTSWGVIVNTAKVYSLRTKISALEKINKTAKRSAFVSALSAKLEQKEVLVVDKFDFKDNKTKQMVAVLDAFKLDKSVLIVLDAANKNVMLASRNIKNAKVVNYDLLNTYEVVSNSKLMFTKDAIKKLEEAYTDGNN